MRGGGAGRWWYHDGRGGGRDNHDGDGDLHTHLLPGLLLVLETFLHRPVQDFSRGLLLVVLEVLVEHEVRVVLRREAVALECHGLGVLPEPREVGEDLSGFVLFPVASHPARNRVGAVAAMVECENTGEGTTGRSLYSLV